MASGKLHVSLSWLHLSLCMQTILRSRQMRAEIRMLSSMHVLEQVGIIMGWLVGAHIASFSAPYNIGPLTLF